MKNRFLYAVVVLNCLCSDQLQAQADSILYHDMQMESQWGSTTVNDLFGCFVRFTPPVYPAQLVGIRAYFRNPGNPSTFKWKVYTDPSGSGNGGTSSVYLSPVALVNPASGTTNQDYSEYIDLTPQNILINSGDVYAGVVQNTGFFGMGIDNLPDGNVAPTRQWQWMNMFGTDNWNTLASQAATGQFGITAFFLPFNTSLPEIEQGIRVIHSSGDNTLDILFSKTQGDAVVNIFDITGRLAASTRCSEIRSTVDLQLFDPGFYILSVVFERIKFTYKFMIQ